MNCISTKAAAAQARMQQLLDSLPNAEERREAAIHTYEVARFCAVLALKRGENADLAEAAGWLHDCWRYASGLSANHAAEGAALAREWLCAMPEFSPADIEAVCTAISLHSRKAQTDETLAEILKDADVLSHFIQQPQAVEVSEEAVRLRRLLTELAQAFASPQEEQA